MFTKKVKHKELLVLFSCFERYDSTGLSTQNAIVEFKNISDNEPLNEILDEIRNDLKNGYDISVALAKYPDIFPGYIIELIKVGEKTGDTAKVYQEIIQYLDEQIKIDTSITSALMMPKIFACLIAILGSAYIFFVLPRMTKQLSQMGTDIPLITRILLSLGEYAVSYWFVGIFLIIAGFIGYRAARVKYPLIFDALKYKLPIVGELYNLQLNYQFAKILSICHGADIEIKRSLKITAQAVTSPCMKELLLKVADKIKRQGSDFVRTLKDDDEYRLLNPFIFPLLNAGMVSDSLGQVLLQEADRNIRQINYAIKGVEEKLGNAVLVPIWGMLIIIMLAIVLPFVSMIEQSGAKIMGGGL